MEATLAGTVRLLFQPAEEGRGGGKVMLEQGALDGAAAVFGLHVNPAAPTGTVQAKVRCMWPRAGQRRQAACWARAAGRRCKLRSSVVTADTPSLLSSHPRSQAGPTFAASDRFVGGLLGSLPGLPADRPACGGTPPPG